MFYLIEIGGPYFKYLIGDNKKALQLSAVLSAEAGELEPFSFNSVYQLVLHLSRLLSVAFL